MIKRTLIAGLLSLSAVAAQGAPPPTGPSATAVQKGRVVRVTDLRDLPASDGKLLEVLQTNAEVAVAERQGGWYKVRVGERQGWVRLTAVRFATATPSSPQSGGLTASLGFLKSGRSAVQTGTVTTGVRGLSETDLANSTPDSEAVDALDQLAVAPEDARQHAKALGLSATKVDFVKVPQNDKDKSKKKGKGDEEDDG